MSRRRRLAGGLAAVLLLAGTRPVMAQPAPVAPGAPLAPIVVGSKPFGESYLLAEMFAQVLEARGLAVTRRPGLGGTEIVFPALTSGAIDVFPEYTGTGLLVILERPLATDPLEVFATVAAESARRFDVRWLPPLGFENTYAMSVRTEMAERLGLRTIGDAARAVPALRAGFTADFIGLPDGLPLLRRAYGLAPASVAALAPALKYRALVEGDVDLIDAYSTDGLLDRYPVTVLRDDRRVFPPYDAAAVVRGATARARPEAVAALTELSGRIDVVRMRRWNAQLEVERRPLAEVAREALAELGVVADTGERGPVAAPGDVALAAYLWGRRDLIAALTARHLWLTLVSLGAAIVAGVAAGLAVAGTRLAEGVTRAVGLLQTVPGLALLAFMLPVAGIGAVPAILALFLYSLYPIVRGTVTGVAQASPQAVDAAVALGMTPRQVLWWVRMPLALPVVMAGIRTSAVTNVGTATLAAFIGGGGLGDPIVAGLALADSRQILSGAIPAALLALVVDVALGRVQWWLTPRALR